VFNYLIIIVFNGSPDKTRTHLKRGASYGAPLCLRELCVCVCVFHIKVV